jgi:predicted methyltransferase
MHRVTPALQLLSKQRSQGHSVPKQMRRDKYRHPLETLTFFGIKPDMTVVEISPGTGWYTEILAPFLKDHGKLYEAVGGGAGAKTLEEKLKGRSRGLQSSYRHYAAASSRN